MLPIFEKYIKAQSTSFTDEEIRRIGAAAIQRKVRKKELLLNAGEVCRYKMFITKGFLRTYRIGSDGSEHLMQFSPELTWTTDGESYANRNPSDYNIDALEDSQLLLWSKDSFDALLTLIPALKAFSDQLISNNLHSSRNRIYKAISSTPEEKYEDFIRTYPGILLRVPLRMVASYLGMSVKTLSRIRQAQLQH
ncbi:cyclic nucleotide-binding domain-containing protein [Pedobacter sp. HMF7647]|uniref:Cyclic nucleotide-binding domain-containing protein n=1 Tax=Hufsiella arboris TaxID=2695275 RepID=A0A7K1Y8F6_9SPHI|nr:Crp/Fnr family transcriptional regulator [Hufsiella arboris]MXV50866.1 cyclic nucleotide-binding domain-containing protein [Hufsiella arboris]